MSALWPKAGAFAGGNTITVAGSGLSAGAGDLVSFRFCATPPVGDRVCGAPATVLFENETMLVVTIPAAPQAGYVALVMESTQFGRTNVSESAQLYRYYPGMCSKPAAQ